MSYPLPAFDPAEVPHNTAGEELNVGIWCLVGVATVFLVLRVACKIFTSRKLWWDDHILVAAWIVLLADAILISVMVHNGLGLHTSQLSPFQLKTLGPLILARASLTIIATVWSKTSFAVTLLRLADGWLKPVLWFILVTMNIAMGLSVLFGFVQCTPIAKSINMAVPGTCWPFTTLLYYSMSSGIYSGVCDIALALLPWTIIWDLKMNLKEKIGVGLAMSMGVGAGAVAFVKSYKLKNLATGDFFTFPDLFIWDVAESCVTIMAASIPVLRVLVRQAATATRRRYYISNGGSDTLQESRRRYHGIEVKSSASPIYELRRGFSTPLDSEENGQWASYQSRRSDGSI